MTERLRDVLLAAFNVVAPQASGRFDADLPIEAIGLDSIGLTQAVFEIEQQLGFELDDETLGALMEARTAGDFHVTLCAAVATRPPAA